MDKQKEVIDDVDVEWTSTDSSDSSSDDELVSTIHRSRFEHEYQQSRRGAETSSRGAETRSEASERNRPATTSGEEILSIPPIARLTKPPRRLSVQSFLRTSNPRSVLTEEDLSDIRGRFGFPNEVQLRLPFKDERADTVSEGWICMYTIYFECGLRLPLPPLLVQCMHHYQLAIPQLMPNGMRVFLGLIVLADEAGVELSVDDVLAIYYPHENPKDYGRYSMYPRRNKQIVGEMKNADRYWQDRYFFMLVNEKSMGCLANAFYPLWGTIRKYRVKNVERRNQGWKTCATSNVTRFVFAGKELKKPPPKALLFEEKLERLLALPSREWDEINSPERLRASSLWKDFMEISTGIPKRVPSWVDWPFIIRGALRRLFGTPLFVDPLTDEEALIAEFVLDTMDVVFPSPKELFAQRKAAREASKAAAAATAENAGKASEPAPFSVLESSPEPPAKPASPPKKRKAVGKGKRKIPAKRSKKSKIASPESNVGSGSTIGENPLVEFDLPSRLRLLSDRKTGVEIMRQLLTEADTETLNQGPPQSLLDDILWDNLKSSIRMLGLFSRTSDKVVEMKARINELQVRERELEERERQREQQLIDIERKFEDTKTSAEDLKVQLQSALHEAKEGSDRLKVMNERYNEAIAKISTLESNNAKLVADIVNEYSRATMKARYDLLKEYKQGLLVEADVDEEIEVYEDTQNEAGCSSSAPADGSAPAQMPNEPETNRAESLADEVVPASIDQGPSGVEPSVDVDLSEDREAQE